MICWIALLGLGACASGVAQDLHDAEQDVMEGRADQAIAELKAFPNSPQAHLLLCRAWLSKLHGSEAAAECRIAIKTGLGENSGAQDWAGRAFGMQAEHAGPFSGLKLAGEVRSAFQAAYTLNKHNPAATNDLGEFYVGAPSLVGGGLDKASALADEVQTTLPEIAHRLRALVAQKHGDMGTAEREFLAATQVAQSPGTLVDLALFYVRQHLLEKAVATAQRSIQANRDLGADLFDAASTLNDAHQPAKALPVLRLYLARGKKSDQAPAFRAHTLIGRILAAEGDKTGARQEFQSALALAAD
ncbi:MAG: hypothetical protein INR62_09750, partial [Rhodospirillales bacterium]|nr:hypothetical protein [Acetobacter sp.]